MGRGLGLVEFDKSAVNRTIDNDYYKKLIMHKKEVFIILGNIIIELAERALLHDESKYNPIEKEIFTKISSKEFGSDEYNEIIKGEAFQHHYKNNRHHPEHFPNGINDMTLIDIIEMLADWVAANKHYGDSKSLEHSLKMTKKRFKYDEQLEKIFSNTINYIQNLRELKK